MKNQVIKSILEGKEVRESMLNEDLGGLITFEFLKGDVEDQTGVKMTDEEWDDFKSFVSNSDALSMVQNIIEELWRQFKE